MKPPRERHPRRSIPKYLLLPTRRDKTPVPGRPFPPNNCPAPMCLTNPRSRRGATSLTVTLLPAATFSPRKRPSSGAGTTYTLQRAHNHARAPLPNVTPPQCPLPATWPNRREVILQIQPGKFKTECRMTSVRRKKMNKILNSVAHYAACNVAILLEVLW